MLSGGQKQKVAIAGALATRPDCIAFDEPTSMLDPPGRRQVLETIRQLNNEGMTIVLITQSMDEAAMARRIVVMNAGRVVLDGTPEEVFAAPGPDGRSPLLPTLGLDQPFAAEIANGLREQGLPLPAGLLTIDQLVTVVTALC
jgi:energy-coupling factor transporter ATP-binding protein EcfA2